jgi:hypothetical protein
VGIDHESPESDVFSREVTPHVTLVFFDFLARQGNAKVRPKASNTFEGLLPDSFVTEFGGMV